MKERERGQEEGEGEGCAKKGWWWQFKHDKGGSIFDEKVCVEE